MPSAQVERLDSTTHEKEKKECISRGGMWLGDTNSGFIPKTGCNEAVMDGGEICDDSSSCEGGCINDETSPTGGRCYGYSKFFGCGKRVKIDGQIAIMCID